MIWYGIRLLNIGYLRRSDSVKVYVDSYYAKLTTYFLEIVLVS